eukprot:1161945-Pelagomonas_calceolata.AAC.4
MRLLTYKLMSHLCPGYGRLLSAESQQVLRPAQRNPDPVCGAQELAAQPGGGQLHPEQDRGALLLLLLPAQNSPPVPSGQACVCVCDAHCSFFSWQAGVLLGPGGRAVCHGLKCTILIWPGPRRGPRLESVCSSLVKRFPGVCPPGAGAPFH